MNMKKNYQGFTLIEISIVLVIVTLLIGFTITLFPKQQELNRYRKVNAEMDAVINSIVAFAQVNGRLPCPSQPNTAGRENGGGNINCNAYNGFVPVGTLGINGEINADGLLLDPWGQPYRYYVSNRDFFEDGGGAAGIDDDADGSPDGDGISDFVSTGEMQNVGIGDTSIDEDNDNDNEIEADQYVDLDADLIVCDQASAIADRCDTLANSVIGDWLDIAPADPGGTYNAAFNYTMYRGAPVVLVSLGKDGAQVATGADQIENQGAVVSVAGSVTGNTYLLANDTIFVKRRTGFADDFDDVVKWISPNVLFSKMIDAGILP